MSSMLLSACFLWCPGAESNHRHCDFQSHALPTELPGRAGRSPSGRHIGERPRPCPASRRGSSPAAENGAAEQMDTVACVIVGAGVVGLAVARALAQAAREVIILEAAEAIGTGISSRNSEVIHAGIYYPKDSLMARFCVAGKRALYEFCASHGVPHKRCGKLIVATNELEAGKLASIEARAR